MKILHNLTKHAILILVISLLVCLGACGMDEDNQMPEAVQVPEVTQSVQIHEIPEETVDPRIADLEEQVEQLARENRELVAQVAEYQAREQEVCILVLRYEKLVLSGILGDAIVIENAVQEIAVSRKLYDSCQNGEDITSTELHRLMTCDGLSDTRVIVENKYIRS